MSGRNTTPKRPIRIEGGVAYIPLTKGYEACIDACDVPLIDGRSWYAQTNGKTVYAVSSAQLSSGKKTLILLHRIISRATPEIEVDHIDGDGLNNRSSNLRNATRAENAQNRGMHSNNTSGYKGVRFCKDRNRWRAEIYLNGKAKNLGHYDTAESAAAAYREAASIFHGEFSRSSGAR